jgi:methionine synthase I (cobalamin-dependent)
MSKLNELLADRPVLAEGGMGTLLMQAGLPAGMPGEYCNIHAPESVVEIHRQYVAAGARVLITNTFNGNRPRLRMSGLEDSFTDTNRSAVASARQAAVDGCVVAGSIGPTGELLAPLGPLSVDAATDAFAEQAATLGEAGVDLLWIETMTDLAEARAALAGCRRVWSGPVSVSMTFNAGPRGFFTMMGNPLAECVAALADSGADIIGSNCQLTSTQMVPLARELVALSKLPVMLEPNAGIPRIVDGAQVYSETPIEFAEAAAQFADAGIALIGGCCGTTPEFIAAARERLGAA